MPFPFLAAASLLSGGISALTGLSQKKQANKIIAENAFPEMSIPSAILQNQRLAQAYSNQGLPSEQYNMARQNIARAGSTALRGAMDRRSGLAAISGIQRNANDANLNLDVQNANAVRQNQRQLMNINNQVGQWQNNVWDWNKRQRYLQNAQTARALLGAGNANLNTGLDRGLSGLLQSGGLFGKKGVGAYAPNMQNPNVSYDEMGNEYYTDQYGNPIK